MRRPARKARKPQRTTRAPVAPAPDPHANETTDERLLRIARRLFAERGFHGVTVRDISREAGANLAAVGYHFGDKLQLYRAVVLQELERMRAGNQVEEPAGLSTEQRIRHYVHASLPRMVQPEAHAEWLQRLLRHEMAQPTPIANEIAEQTYRPRVRYLAQLVAELLDCAADDMRVQHSVFSIQAQCMFYVRDSFRSSVFADWPPQTSEQIHAAADHIVNFSLAGIEALGARKTRRRR
jgi:AcrR family transcriptional regulator